MQLRPSGNRRIPRRKSPRHVVLIARSLYLFFLVSSLTVYSRGVSQTITLKLKDAPIQEVFSAIAKQTGVTFIYTKSQIQQSKPISIDVTNESLAKVLDLVFKSQPITYSIDSKLVIIKNKTATAAVDKSAEDETNPIDVTGRVTNERGDPVGGVTVMVKGSDIITTTNNDGEFNIRSVARDAVLVFTSVNMETFELKVSGKTELAIKMKAKVSELDDVTVTLNTGYEKVPKERATGSFEFISNEKLNRKAGTDVLSRLEGVSTSILFDRRKLSPNQTTIPLNNIVVRGLSTLTETMKRPLIILDNFPYEEDINNLNPNDIESITVLKDAAAASIWGARAANGVIVINTKQGQFNQPVRVSFNGNVTLAEKPDLFYLPRMSTADFIENEIFLFGKGFYNSNISNTVTRLALTPVVEILAKRRSGLISAQDSALLIGQLINKDIRNDFDKYIDRSSVAQQYSINLSGGASNIKYLFSVGFDKNMYSLTGNDYQRINVRTEIAARPVKNLELNIGTIFTSSVNEVNSLGEFGASAYEYRSGKALYPYAQLADENGNALVTVKDYRSGYTDTAGAGKLLDWKYRILDEVKNSENTTKTQSLLFNFSSNYKLTNYLSLTGNYQFEFSNGDGRKLMSDKSYYTRNLVNLYTQISPGAIVNNVPTGGILDQSFSQLRAHAGRLQANLNKNWSTEHRLVAIVGGEIREKRQSQSVNRLYGYNDNNLSTALVDYVKQYPLYGNRGNSLIPYLNSVTKNLDRFVSLFGNAAYTFQNKYIVSASVRKDAANLFGVNTNDKWKPFWTVGLSWNISNEKFINNDVINYLKLRGSYGYQGNVNNLLAPYTVISYSPASSSPVNQPFASISVPANPGLSWEKIRQINMGLDFGILKSRISGSIDVYSKNTDNLILQSEIDPTSGIASVFKNSASMTGKGIDLSIQTVNVSGKDFKWTTEILLSHITTKVKDFSINTDNLMVGDMLNGGGANGLNIYPLRGKAPYSIFSFRFAGLNHDTGNPQGYLGKNISTDYTSMFFQKFDTADLVYNGSAIPTVFGFLNNIINYKGISLAINVSYKFGYFFRKTSINYYRLNNSNATHPDFAKRWLQPGDELVTTIPSRVYPVSNSYRDDFYAYSTATVLKGDHVRLQYIRLGYEINKATAARFGVKGLQVYLLANNLGILWRANDEKIDPDYDPGTTSFPPPKSVTAGIKIDL